LAVLAFKVGPLQFDLNRDLKFISMRDQVVRARTLILGAREAGLIGPSVETGTDKANVIVIGGGVGGVSTALMACQLGFSVKLVESDSECFSLLGLGSDRLFSATIYDWPHEHSGSHEFPYVASLRDIPTALKLRTNSTTLRFPSSAVTAGALRADFIAQLKVAEATYGSTFEVLRSHKLNGMVDVSLNQASGIMRVDAHGPGGTRHLTGQIVVFAIGFGLDKNSAQTSAAKDFFSYSGLKSDLTKAMTGNRFIRIVGAGDGGLQEALRFVLEDSWHDFHRCVSELRDLLRKGGHGDEWSQMCARLQSAEDQAARAAMWGYTEELVYGELNLVYERELKLLLNIAPTPVSNWHSQVVRPQNLLVELVDDSTFSKKVYGLNRWLAGLLYRLSDPQNNRAALTRITPDKRAGVPDVELIRAGFAATEKQRQIGTVDSGDLLRRIAFQGIPMNMDPVV
jgi:hypothetical protein